VAYNCFDISSFYCPIRGVCVHFTAIDGFLVVNSPVELERFPAELNRGFPIVRE
jgi:hypothetical protein